jgi:uncharacterized membrane protein affecting hemolysin expression
MSPDRQFSRNQRTRQAVAVLCLMLVSVLSVAQVAHDHGNDAKAAQHCSVCFAAHLSLARSATVTATPILVSRIAAIAERESVTSLLLTENAYIRPPPVA